MATPFDEQAARRLAEEVVHQRLLELGMQSTVVLGIAIIALAEQRNELSGRIAHIERQLGIPTSDVAHAQPTK